MTWCADDWPYGIFLFYSILFYFSYEDETSRWIAKHGSFPHFLGVLNNNAVLGVHEWTVYNDSKLCNWHSSYKTMLSLSSCRIDQFTCNDGNCVNMDKRLNQSWLYIIWGVPPRSRICLTTCPFFGWFLMSLLSVYHMQLGWNFNMLVSELWGVNWP